MRLFFLIRSLERGGAERQLIELVGGLSKNGHDVTVCTFYEGGAMLPELQANQNVRLLTLGKRSRWDIAAFTGKLLKAVRATRPQVVHGYMGVANELALVAARACRAKVVWGLRASDMDLARYGQVARRVFEGGSLLSRYADAIIVNSRAGRSHHIARGYSADRMVVVPNGIDCERFRPDAIAASRLRYEWGIRECEPLVGIVARLDPMKDHENFLQAGAHLLKLHSSVRFVCVGQGDEAYSRSLRNRAESLGFGNRLQWFPARDDMPAVYNALDVCVLSSAFGEGFPNVVGEAMAAGRPCVVTRVGDAEIVVGDAGIAVQKRDAYALACGIAAMLDKIAADRLALGERARAHIVANFSRARLIKTTEELLAAVCSGRSLPSSMVRADG